MVIERLVAEEDPAWERKMEEEVQRGENLLANAAALRSRTALAEVAMQQESTIKRA